MVNLSVAEKEYLYTKKQIDICVDPTWPPLDFIDDKGEHSGLSADLINKIAKRIGISLTLIPTSSWEESLASLKQGRCDIIPLMNETEESRSYIDFTPPYFEFATVIATRRDASFIGDYSELHGKKVALQAYYFITEYVREHHPQIEIIEVENTRAALKLVSEQKAFATIDGLPNIVNNIESLALENIKIVGSLPQENRMKMGVAKGNPLLFSILSKGVVSLSEKEKIGLYKKWFDIEVSNQFFNRRLIIQIGVGLIGLMGILLWRQFMLGKNSRQLQTLNKKLHYFSTVDHLTMVLNRRSIEKQLEKESRKSTLLAEPLAIVICDIDHFKQVNDTFGHTTGDRVLAELAELVLKSVRQNDYFGRWGGEEFLFILPHSTCENALKFIENLKKKIEGFDFGIDQSVTMSFGLGQHQAKEGTNSLLTRVDTALYQAKGRGRNCIVVAEADSAGVGAPQD